MNIRSRILWCALLVWPALVCANEPACRAGVVDASQPDGARLRIRTVCVEDGQAVIEFLAATPGSAAFTPVAETMAALDEEEPPSSAYFDDLNKDGYQEIVARGMCGAGPNCLGAVYRWDRGSATLRRFINSGWADLSFVDGYLVTAGRASCCAWEFSAYRWGRDAGYDDDAERELSVEVATEYAQESGEPDTVRCTFSRKAEGEWHVVPPPSRAWLKFCETYDQPYYVEGPEDTD